MHRTYASSISENAKEVVREQTEEGIRVADCLVDGEVVGRRRYWPSGLLEFEQPMLEGVPHGNVYTFDSEGRVVSCEPHERGLPHGTAKQWDEQGRLLGTYEINHGTGLDLWWQTRTDGSAYLAECLPLVGGKRHGTEWWFEQNQCAVYVERYWFEGQLHGIEREWSDGRLEPEFPRFFIEGAEVSLSEYEVQQSLLSTLPPYRAEDDDPLRDFPPPIVQHLRPRD